MPDIDQIKAQICDVGRRMYRRQFVAANDGNISCRVADDQVLCTPTLHCKGFLEPDDLTLIDMEGNQIAGHKKPSSESKLHLEIYRHRDDVTSVVHCHPPHATAFAIAREPIPQCVLPEVELCLGEVPIAPYQTPGSEAFAKSVLPFVQKACIIVLANHGTVSYGDSVEQAYWWTEILDSYCRTLILAKQLGHITPLQPHQARDLLEVKKRWGYQDPRNTPPYTGCDVCGHQVFGHTWADAGVTRRAFPPPHQQPSEPIGDESNQQQIEQIVRLVVQQIQSMNQ